MTYPNSLKCVGNYCVDETFAPMRCTTTNFRSHLESSTSYFDPDDLFSLLVPNDAGGQPLQGEPQLTDEEKVCVAQEFSLSRSSMEKEEAKLNEAYLQEFRHAQSHIDRDSRARYVISTCSISNF